MPDSATVQYEMLDEASEAEDALLAASKSTVDVVPVSTEEPLHSQLVDKFCAAIRSRLNRG